MNEQMTIDDWIQSMDWSEKNPKPCDCGSRNLWMRIIGRGIGNYASYPPTFQGYSYRVYCLECGRHSWDECHWVRVRKDDAWEDWNFRPRKKSYDFEAILREKRQEDMICCYLGQLH